MNVCPICQKKVQEWQMASGKAVVIDGKIYHKSCRNNDKDDDGA